MDIDQQNKAFADLGPEHILESVESAGFVVDGRLLVLASYENRVYQVGIDDAEPIIAKFYRPGRWSDEAIVEEHEFTRELMDAEIPVVGPLSNDDGQTLFHHGPYRFSLSPRRGGRAPELDDASHLEFLGRLIGRIHAIGSQRTFAHRPTINIEHFGHDSVTFLKQSSLVPFELETGYFDAADNALEAVKAAWQRAGDPAPIRVHGDFHIGNVLWRDEHAHIVDLDDARNGPAVQDIWIMLSGDRPFMSRCLADILIGYTDFHEFDPRQLHLVEALRALRIIYHAAWIGKRWDDPAFPKAFPWYGDYQYWEAQSSALRECLVMIDEPPLPWA